MAPKPANPNPDNPHLLKRADPAERPPIDPRLKAITSEHRVRIKRDECGDPIVPGKNGHLYTDPYDTNGKYVGSGKVYVCFSDDGCFRADGRPRWFTKKMKTYALAMLRAAGFVRLKQEGDFEFIAEIGPEVIATALFKVLRVRRFRAEKGISRAVPPAMVARQFKKRGVDPA